MPPVAESNLPNLALTFVAATIVGAVMTYVVRNYARRKNWVCQPASHHIHKHGIPRLGGVAVYSTFVLLYFITAITGVNPEWRHQVPIFAAASVLFVVGLIDDFRSLSARVKLGFQILAAALLFAAGVRGFAIDLVQISIRGWQLGWLVSLAATVAWVLLITNALNLIDGLDGLAAGSSLFSIVALCGLALAEHHHGVVFATVLLGGAVLGFLRYNFNPATIFLGDAGSLFLGAMLSGLALQPTRAAAPTFVATVIPLVAFGLPVVEVGISVVRRFLSGKPLFSPDRDHIHHRLMQLGFSHRQTVIALYGICAGCALLSLFLAYPARSLVGFVLLLVGTMFVVGVQRLGYPEFREFGRLAHRTIETKKVIANNVAIRNAAIKIKAARSTREIREALDGLLRFGEFDSYTLIFEETVVIHRESIDAVISYDRKANGRGRKFDSRPQTRAGWSVRLDLHSADDQVIGRFSIGRRFRRRSVLVDVNLIVNDLQPALSAACARLASDAASAEELQWRLSAPTPSSPV